MDLHEKTVGEPVTLTVCGTPYSLPKGTAVGDFLTRRGLLPPHATPCGGHGRCGKCRVMVEDYHYAVAGGALNPPTADEMTHLTGDDLAAGVRLACCLTVWGDVSLTVVGGGTTARNTPAADMVICTEGGTSSVGSTVGSPLFTAYGVAVDVGTTTLVAKLYDRSGHCLGTAARPNPQAVWGADVVTRMEAATNGKAAALSGLVRRAIEGLLSQLAADHGVTTKDMDGLVVTGNTPMLCLLTATDPTPMTRAPFTLPRRFGETMTAADLGISVLAPHTPVYLPPVVSPFIGADTVTALLGCDMTAQPGTTLLLDLGTNGEMVLWHDGKLTAASTAAGPAFEGVGISVGMTARAGAIDRAWVAGRDLCTHTIGETAPLGLCGSGLVDVLAALLETGRLDPTGHLTDDPTRLTGDVSLTQADVRAVQVAKAAIRGGIDTLLDKEGLTARQVETVLVAGGLGHALSPNNALRIGLFPSVSPVCIHPVGNAALAGAACLLLDGDLCTAARDMARRVTVLDLATSPIFAAAFVAGMDL